MNTYNTDNPTMRSTSIITRINVALATIIIMAATTILISFWLSAKSDNDAYVINKTGSMRMNSYRMGLNDSTAGLYKAKVEAVFNDPTVNTVSVNANLTNEFSRLKENWQTLNPKNTNELDHFVNDIHTFVGHMQQHAEAKIRVLRNFQIAALLFTMVLSWLIIIRLRQCLTLPLRELTDNARQISNGIHNFKSDQSSRNDELGVLARSLEHMCDTVAHMYLSLEKQVNDKTKELQNSNKTLMFLYDIARRISTHEISKEDFNNIINELSSITGIKDIELCLLTESGDIPYLQINGNKERDCFGRDCRSCLMGEYETAGHLHYNVSRESHDYGVLVIHKEAGPLLAWKEDLVTSVCSLFAIALSLQHEEENIRRMTLINERTIIARELHDSLAQALSYLKIQVSRLNRAISSDNNEVMSDVSNELKEGLDSAYRHLRELLTTFRLKIDGEGLSVALAETINQYKLQSDMSISLDYQLINVPLSPQEEIHLLQIIRESCQNAINHSHGSTIKISLHKHENNQVTLLVDDNGVGINPDPEKLNHYGLAIVQERARQLNGKINIGPRDEGGTRVEFTFTPEFYN